MTDPLIGDGQLRQTVEADMVPGQVIRRRNGDGSYAPFSDEVVAYKVVADRGGWRLWRPTGLMEYTDGGLVCGVESYEIKASSLKFYSTVCHASGKPYRVQLP